MQKILYFLKKNISLWFQMLINMAKKKEKTEVRQFDKITNRKDSPTVVRRRSPTVVRRCSPTQKSKGRDLGVYVNLLTDFGFKRIFGIKEVMLNFLNTILASKIKDKIVDLHYDNTERLGITQSDRKAIYDLICTTEKDERIVVEMQALWHEYFMDRIVSYASRMIQDQNIVGEDWDFKLQPVYLISIVNFPFDKAERFANKHTSFVQLVERDTRQVFYNKLTFVFIELPRFNKELHQLKTFFEKWIYIIRNLHTMKELPDKFRNEVFEKLFEVAKIA